ncbi:MAG: aminoacyl-tRNA hydrolase, partial [Spirochaetes bacterium]|nr:aminoacyl-tRNA hydrolase [Spirochaetota bacterium]
MIRINRSLSIPDDEITITASRSSGPGGQNVNKVATKVTLRFSVAKTPSLTDAQKGLVMERLRNSINRQGTLVIHDESGRSQAANRARVIKKFSALMARSLVVPRKRVPTRASRA